MTKPVYRRVVVKVSGEALMGPDSFGIHQPTVERIAADLAAAHRLGVAIAVVAGGGNIFRGAIASEMGMDRASADTMGMLATVINALDPDAIVLGGGMSNVALLYERVPRLLGQYVFSDAVSTRLVPPAHGDSSGVRGAAWLWPRP